MITLAKTPQNIFSYSFVYEHSKHFFYFKKKPAFLSGAAGVDQTPHPPLADASVKFFICRAPLLIMIFLLEVINLFISIIDCHLAIVLYIFFIFFVLHIFLMFYLYLELISKKYL